MDPAHTAARQRLAALELERAHLAGEVTALNEQLAQAGDADKRLAELNAHLVAATEEAMRIVSPGSGTPKSSKKISSPTAMSP